MRDICPVDLKRRLLAGETVGQISAEFDVGESTCRRRIKRLRLSPAENKTIRDARGYKSMRGVPARMSGNNDVLMEIRGALIDRKRTPSSMENLSPAEKGRIGELYVKYVLARLGIAYADMPYNTDDIIVMGKDGVWKKCEIKTASRGYDIQTKRMRYRAGKFVHIPYENIDFYILVALETEEFFVVPANEISKTDRMCCSPFGVGWKYRFRTDLF